ncbi:NAD-dependent epimerase/dehydratase family protein [Epilithonimonas hungarica]|uniref:Nucleoside-diphosphate-sugar epimerase n=1 Tax=Epilithonimonas hungarica TaxID=454006 RepID=A0A1G7RVC2_9FLAO|nr:NAD-dependent epimerase/dehydratase family protein [Epilithonimonas hungarica]MPT32284.1 NAD-dependent epimerase/dehydratase family protein [Chryseobacterium sp.]SDG14745.1 Nucleoside-diphosphate-sugar epimerase [Epilithonimonas hungarica]
MILITGATGILGRVIALELLKKGKKVRATKRKSSNLKDVSESYRFYTERPDFYFDQIEWMDVDFEDLDSLQNVLKDVDEVYHCAAKVSFDPKDEKSLYKNNSEATEKLLFAIDPLKVKKFLFVSSIAVLDGFNEKGEMDENSDFNEKLHHSDYAISKYVSEMEVWRAQYEGLNTVIINPGLIIGSGNWNHSSGKLFKELSNRFTFPGSTAYVDVRDVAKVAIELMEKSIFGQRFIVTSENVKYKTISDKVRKVFGKSPVKIISNSILDLLPFFSMIFGWFIPILKLGNKTNVETVKSDSKITNKKIRETLGYEFIPIDESVDFHLKNYTESLKS